MQLCHGSLLFAAVIFGSLSQSRGTCELLSDGTGCAENPTCACECVFLAAHAANETAACDGRYPVGFAGDTQPCSLLTDDSACNGASADAGCVFREPEDEAAATCVDPVADLADPTADPTTDPGGDAVCDSSVPPVCWIEHTVRARPGRLSARSVSHS
jgi:hypothetical protein